MMPERDFPPKKSRSSTSTMTAALSDNEMIELLTCPIFTTLFHSPVIINCQNNTDKQSKKLHIFEEEAAKMMQMNKGCCATCGGAFTSYTLYEPYQKLLEGLLRRRKDLIATQYTPGHMKIETLDEKAEAARREKDALVAAGFTEAEIRTQDAAFASPALQAALWAQFAKPRQASAAQPLGAARQGPMPRGANHFVESSASYFRQGAAASHSFPAYNSGDESPDLDEGFDPDDMQAALAASMAPP